MFVYLLLILISNITAIISDNPDDNNDWMSIKLPEKSYFMGFAPPTDAKKWEIAKQQARDGKLVLLPKIIEQIPNPQDIVDGDTAFRWIHRMGDVFLTTEKNNDPQKVLDEYFIPVAPFAKSEKKIPVVLFGYREFENKQTHSGNWIHFHPFTAENTLNYMRDGKLKLNRKIIGVGSMDENWGWLSTHILNRTCLWGMGFGKDPRDSPYMYHTEQIKPFLDDPNLVMLVVNQHHNVTHPKVISIPRGMERYKVQIVRDQLLKAVKDESMRYVCT